jgi:N-methylhydantoinase A
MASDVVHVHERSLLMPAPFDVTLLNEAFERLEADAVAQLEADGFDRDAMELRRTAEMKFSLQINQVEVPVPGGRLDEADAAAQVERFIARYEEIYGRGSGFADAGSQIGLVRVRARGRVATPELPRAATDAAEAPTARDVHWGGSPGFLPTAIHGTGAVAAGLAVEGPAIVELPSTAIAVPPGSRAAVDEFGSIVIERSES